MTEFTTNGNTKFNSLQATLRKQMSHGLTFQAAYSWSRDFTNLTWATGAPPGTNSSNLNNPNNPQYGLNPQYRPQRLVISYTYQIPSGKLGGPLGVLARGWSVSGLTTIQDGNPMNLIDSRGGAIFGLSGNSGTKRVGGTNRAWLHLR